MVKKRTIPLCIANIDQSEIDAVAEVLQSGWLAHGPKVKEFEENFAELIGVKYALAMNSCTSALELSLQCIEKKGEVLLPSFTFVASANAVITTGHHPVFVDIDPLTRNIDIEDAKSKLSNDTVAIMPVHWGGLSCEMDEIMDLSRRHGLMVIEDSAETLGGKYKGEYTGSFGIGCFSFYPTKNLTTGEGGMLTTNDDDLAHLISMYRAHGISGSAYDREKLKQPWERKAQVAGFNYRMCDILAAVGVVQLSKLEAMNRKRREHAEYLNYRLPTDYLSTPFAPEYSEHVYQMYTIILKEGVDRPKFINSLRERGVMASVHFDPPVHHHYFYKNLIPDQKNLPNTEKVSSRIVTLPMYPGLERADLDYMIDCVGISIEDSI